MDAMENVSGVYINVQTRETRYVYQEQSTKMTKWSYSFLHISAITEKWLRCKDKRGSQFNRINDVCMFIFEFVEIKIITCYFHVYGRYTVPVLKTERHDHNNIWSLKLFLLSHTLQKEYSSLYLNPVSFSFHRIPFLISFSLLDSLYGPRESFLLRVWKYSV